MLDADDVCRHIRELAERRPGEFCDLLYRLAEDLKMCVHGRGRGEFAPAAREAGYALAEVSLRYGRVADGIARQPEMPFALAAE